MPKLGNYVQIEDTQPQQQSAAPGEKLERTRQNENNNNNNKIKDPREFYDRYRRVGFCTRGGFCCCCWAVSLSHVTQEEDMDMDMDER